MKTSHYVLITTAVAALLLENVPSRAADRATQSPTNTSLRVQSVRIARSTKELQSRFGTRYYGDGQQGVNLQLLLNVEDAFLLSPARDAIVVETFVDDTYQSLLSGNSGEYVSSSGNIQPVVSENGHSLLFSVSGNRPPAEEAERVFVRGFVEARISRSEMKTEKTTLPLTVGQNVTAGPFRATLRSVGDNGGGSVSINLAIEGETASLRKVRAYREGEVERPGFEERQPSYSSESSGRTTTVYLTVRGSAKDPVTLEFNYAEKVEPVRIPFEAQVDLGVTKAGPVESWDGKKGRARPRRTAHGRLRANSSNCRSAARRSIPKPNQSRSKPSSGRRQWTFFR
jgi:hypothetical protein